MDPLLPFRSHARSGTRYATAGGISNTPINVIRSSDSGMVDLTDPICVVVHPGGKWVYVLSQGNPSSPSRGYGAIVLFQRDGLGSLTHKGTAASMHYGDPAGSPQGIHQSSVRIQKPANDGLAMTSDGAFLYATGILSDGLSQYVSLPRRRDEGGGMGRVGGEQGEVWGKYVVGT